MPTHCSILAWRIPWTEEPGGLPSTVLQRVEHDWAHTQLSLKEVISIKEPGSCRLLGRGCVCVVVTPPAAAAAESLSRVQLCATLWTAARKAPLSIGFSRQEYWSGLPCPPPGGLPDPGIKPWSPALQADSLLLSHQGKSLPHF